MVMKKEAAKRRLNLVSAVFSAEEVYREARKAGDALKYTFIEREQEFKPAKYGHERKFVFMLTRHVDDFARVEVEIEMRFENLNKVKHDGKELDKGDVDMVLTSNVVLDYRNRWGMRRFHRALFDFYLEYFVKERFKKLYFIPAVNDLNAIYEAIKERAEYYR